ncbi:hypothetical protein [Neglectibacter caecimuris]|uniref:hypothetical protein n=1 Tax=Neglectibacter caecimuris TaxID=3093658 RepID=UPI002AC8C5E1|nr:hypothetical protein [Neglectibacter sp. M00184]
MSYVYFPSCNFTAASPEAAERIKAFLEKRMPVAGCCRVDQTDYSEKTVVYFCQACREVLEEKGNRRQKAENLFVYLDRDTEFSWPDYSGLTVTVQDCWRDREHPEIFDAVRSCLRKMGIAVLEMEENRESSVFCGNLHFVPRNPENRELLARFPDTPLYKLPSEAEEQLMREQVEKHPCPLAVCYCNRCVKGVVTGGGKAVHLLELVTETWKE